MKKVKILRANFCKEQTLQEESAIGKGKVPCKIHLISHWHVQHRLHEGHREGKGTLKPPSMQFNEFFYFQPATMILPLWISITLAVSADQTPLTLPDLGHSRSFSRLLFLTSPH